ncbi:MAG: peptidoglycan DD-metalloendopeptidase family protein [Chloroflexota bacterium]|jgi:murein DD-endopeptidase MepM/ murein hydrolase activator NlpD
MRIRLDGMVIAGIALLVLFAFNLLQGWVGEPGHGGAGPYGELVEGAIATPEAAAEPVTGGQLHDPSWHMVVAPPYDTYFLTQGLHGQSYGHLAVDIAAGNGSTIYSIINGAVTGKGYDEWGNTYIQLENENYVVLYLHGVYTREIGQLAMAGEQIGTESNLGYTMDMYGNLCAGRDCGYHTHLNVYDKNLGSNIDPLSLIPANYP